MRITAKLVASKLDDVLLFFFIALFLMSGIPTSNSFKSNKILKGSVIRVVVLNYPPIMTIKKDSTGAPIFEGATFALLDYISKALDISFEPVFLKEENAKKYGLTPAQLQLISDGDADLVPLGITASHIRFQQFDLSTPMMIEPFRLIVPWPKEESRLLAPVRPFQLSVWICLAISLVAVGSLLTWLTVYNSNKAMNFEDFVQNNMYLWSHLTKNRFYTALRNRASYVIVGIWCLMTVVLANAYAGTLYSVLTVTKLEPVINSLEKLAYTGNVQLLIQARSELTERILNASSGTEMLIGDSLRANPGNMFYDPRQVVNKLMTGKFALAQFNIVNYGLIDATYRANGKKCRVTLANEPIAGFTPVVQYLAKNGPFTQAISEQIQAQIDTGIMDHTIKLFMPRIDQCLMNNQKKTARLKSLTLMEMSSAFVVFGLGMGLSLLTLLFEFILFYLRKLRICYK